MIKNLKKFQAFSEALSKTTGPLPYHKALRIFTSLWMEGVSLETLPPKDPLEGIETDIRVARILNSCLKNSSQN
jgi:hypothetical protein